MAFGRRIVYHGRDRVQISTWRDRDDVATMVPYGHRDVVAVEAVHRAVDRCVDAGFESAYTAALTPTQAQPFVAAGFDLFEELYLLERPVDAASTAEKTIRRGRRGDWDQVIALDSRAFEPFWHFDRAAMNDAMRATPRCRFAVSRVEPVVGYQICGLAARDVYLQRVAVDPSAHGQGWGTRLVNDALWWGSRHGAERAHVNTQMTNDAALALYLHCGFEMANHRLQVLHRRFGSAPAPHRGSGAEQ